MSDDMGPPVAAIAITGITLVFPMLLSGCLWLARRQNAQRHKHLASHLLAKSRQPGVIGTHRKGPSQSSITTSPHIGRFSLLIRFISWSQTPIFNGSYAAWLALFWYIAIQVIILLLRRTTDGISVVTADLAIGNLCILFLFASRHAFFSYLFGYHGWERRIKWHRWVGRVVIYTGSFHAFTEMGKSYAASGWTGMASGNQNKTGIIALTLLQLMTIFSHAIFRRYTFELFYYTHFLYVGFVITVMLHAKVSMYFVLPGLILHFADKVYRFFVSRVRYRDAHLIGHKILPGRVLRLTIQPSAVPAHAKLHHRPPASATNPFPFIPGQYIFLCVPKLGRLQWHPFSISSAGGRSDFSFDVHIKDSGYWTAQLAKVIQQTRKARTALPILIEGPYGGPVIEMWEDANIAIFIAGGIGITAFIGVLTALSIKLTQHAPICLQRLHLIWIIRHEEQYTWFGRELLDLHERIAKLPSMFRVRIDVFVTQPTHPLQLAPSFYRGRPDLKTILPQAVAKARGNVRIGICGPKPMIEQCADITCNLSRKDLFISTHIEHFDF